MFEFNPADTPARKAVDFVWKFLGGLFLVFVLLSLANGSFQRGEQRGAQRIADEEAGR